MYRYDEAIKHIELDYPRDMSYWRGIGYHIDSAFQYTDGKIFAYSLIFHRTIILIGLETLGKTYFFKGKHFWRFDDSIQHVAHHNPELSSVRWMKCSKSRYSDESDKKKMSGTTLPQTYDPSSSSSSSSASVMSRNIDRLHFAIIICAGATIAAILCSCRVRTR